MSTGDKLIVMKWVGVAMALGLTAARLWLGDFISVRKHPPAWVRVLYESVFWLSLVGSALILVSMALKELWHL